MGSTSHLKHTAVDCPQLTGRLHAYMKTLGLNFACFDFAVSKDGELVFLECNCNGQWLWVQERTGQPIGKAIADELVRHASDAKA
jgi:glutathione synthase/RimK-type ligase-like ATP-grasp enzyme